MRCKRFLAALCCGCLFLTAAGCGRSAADKRHIAVIVKAVDSDFWQSVRSGVNAAATEYQVAVTFEGPASEEDYETQNAMIARAAADGADAIVLSAIDYQRSADAVTEAVRHGVKVVAIDSAVGSPAVSLFVGTDNRAAGQAAAEAAIRDFAPSETIALGLVNFAEDTDNGRQREQGLREFLSTVPNAEIVAAVNADSNTESATAAALSLLRDYPQINVLVGFNEWMSLGVGYAIRQAGAADRVRGIGFDANTVSVEMLESGEMDALIVQNPFAIGYLGVKNAAELVAGEGTSETAIYTAVATADRSNLFDSDMQKLLFRF